MATMLTTKQVSAKPHAQMVHMLTPQLEDVSITAPLYPPLMQLPLEDTVSASTTVPMVHTPHKSQFLV